MFTRRMVLASAGCLLPLTGGDGRFEQTDLFAQGQDGVHTYRIPALVETRKRTLLAVADARHDGPNDLPARISLVVRRSSDGGKHWSAVDALAEVKPGGVGDASLLADPTTGRIWCFYAFGGPGIGFFTAKAGGLSLEVRSMFSDDDGRTWSQPVDISPQIKRPEWMAMFATSGTHFATSRGRYLVPMVVREDEHTIAAHNAYSDDRGQSWKIGPAIGSGTDESKAVELPGGVVLENMRAKKARAIARSRDGGISFGDVTEDPALVDPSCNAGIVAGRIAGRSVLVFTNAAAAERKNLTVKISYDSGATWPLSRTIHEGPAAYSTVVILRDETIAVLYERGERYAAERISFARFNLDWVRAAR